MKENTRLQQIREAERKSHIEIYSDKNSSPCTEV